MQESSTGQHLAIVGPQISVSGRMEKLPKIRKTWAADAGEADEIIVALAPIQTQADILLENVAVHPDHQGVGPGRRMSGVLRNWACTATLA